MSRRPDTTSTMARHYLHEIEGYDRRDPQFDEQGVEKGRIRSNIGYSLEAVAGSLDGMGGPPDLRPERHADFRWFLVLDALIANTDRHPRNWAVLEDRTTGRRASLPRLTMGPALGAGLTDPNRETRDVGAFCRKGMANPFTPAPNRRWSTRSTGNTLKLRPDSGLSASEHSTEPCSLTRCKRRKADCRWRRLLS